MVVVTEPASGLTPISAVLRGTVNPGYAAMVYFEYGLMTPDYGVRHGRARKIQERCRWRFPPR